MYHHNQNEDWAFMPSNGNTAGGFQVKIHLGRDSNQQDRERLCVHGPIALEQGAGAAKLAAGKFRIKRSRRGTIGITAEPGTTAGNDERCLLTSSEVSGPFGAVAVLKDGTTGTLIKRASARNTRGEKVAFAAILEVGEAIAVRRRGRGMDEVVQYVWNGRSIDRNVYAASEWEIRSDSTDPDEEVRVDAGRIGGLMARLSRAA